MNTANGIPIPETQPRANATGNVFQFVDPNMAQDAQGVASGLLSGDIWEASRARANEAFARAASSARGATASEFAPAVGQGAAVRAQQGVEQNILGQLSDLQLGFAEQEAEGKVQGANLAIQLENLGGNQFNRRMGAVQTLLDSGGVANNAEAARQLGEMFPGMQFDFSNENLSQGMQLLGNLVSTGISIDQAMVMAEQQGIGSALNMDATQLRGIYSQMQRQANPMLAMVDSLTQFAQETGDAAMVESMVGGYLQTLTGMEMQQGADGSWSVVPDDGFTKVNSLAQVLGGDSVKLSRELTAPNGVKLPPGNYTIVETTYESEDKNYWSGEVTTNSDVVTVAVDENGRHYEIKRKKASDVTEDHTSFSDVFWPL